MSYRQQVSYVRSFLFAAYGSLLLDRERCGCCVCLLFWSTYHSSVTISYIGAERKSKSMQPALKQEGRGHPRVGPVTTDLIMRVNVGTTGQGVHIQAEQHT